MLRSLFGRILQSLLLLAFLCISLSGCGTVSSPASPIGMGTALNGKVHGGQQPVSGAKVYLYAASASGYSNPATSLLGGQGYVTTDAAGGFSITGDYTCPAGAYVYAIALGGNPGLAAGTSNPELALMAGLGTCTGLLQTPYISINEVTTVASVFALAQFAASETQIGTSATNILGLKNAFATIDNLVDRVSGSGLATTPAGNGTVPLAKINTLANALAACVNTAGNGTACNTLMSAANVTGTAGTPIDTIQAAINLARNPLLGATAVYSLSSGSAPFQPTLTAVPNDWTLAVTFANACNYSMGLAFDASGNVWLSNYYGNNVLQFSPNGAMLSPAGGYTSATLYGPQQLAVDSGGNVWVNSGNHAVNGVIVTNASVIEFSSNGTVLSGTNGFTGGGYASGVGILVDTSGNVWTAGAGILSEFNSAGKALSPSSGWASQGVGAGNIAQDSNGNIWMTSYNSFNSGGTTGYSPFLSKISPAGAPLLNAQGPIGGGLYGPSGIAVDRVNNLWMSDYGNSSNNRVAEFNNAGTAVSPGAGYPVSKLTSWVLVDGDNFTWSSPATAAATTGLNKMAPDGSLSSGVNGYVVPGGGFHAAVDPSGNLWMGGISSLVELVGIAGPVATPVVAQVSANQIGKRP